MNSLLLRVENTFGPLSGLWVAITFQQTALLHAFIGVMALAVVISVPVLSVQSLFFATWLLQGCIRLSNPK